MEHTQSQDSVDQALEPLCPSSAEQTLDQQRRIAYLQAMGIPVWLSRSSNHTMPPMAAATSTKSVDVAQAQTSRTQHSTIEIVADLAANLAAKPTPLAKQAPSHPSAVQVAQTTIVDQPTKLKQADDLPLSHTATWESLAQQVTRCQRCEIHRYRTQTVFGVGNRQADWMIIGEAPGADEDRQGEPFVGRAGQLLTNILAAINLPREQVYIANVLKCRPPNNRDPHKKEIQHCEGYLKRQIELVQPKVILVVGRIAAQTLLQTSLPVGKMRGKIHRLPESQIPLVVTYHPAYLLRQPVEKRKVWDDLRRAREVYDPLNLNSNPSSNPMVHQPTLTHVDNDGGADDY
ncbi:MAG: uracil-DNA glycosylase [bacterium]